MKNALSVLTMFTLCLVLTNCSSVDAVGDHEGNVETQEQNDALTENVQDALPDESYAYTAESFASRAGSILRTAEYADSAKGWGLLGTFQEDVPKSVAIVNNYIVSVIAESPGVGRLIVASTDDGAVVFTEEIAAGDNGETPELSTTLNDGKYWVHLLYLGAAKSDSDSLEKGKQLVTLKSLELVDEGKMSLTEDTMEFSAETDVQFSSFEPDDQSPAKVAPYTYIYDSEANNIYFPVDSKIEKLVENQDHIEPEFVPVVYSISKGEPVYVNRDWKLTTASGGGESWLAKFQDEDILWQDNGYLFTESGHLIDLEKQKLAHTFDDFAANFEGYSDGFFGQEADSFSYSVSNNRQFVTINGYAFDVANNEEYDYEESETRNGVEFTAVSNEGLAFGWTTDSDSASVDLKSGEVSLADSPEDGRQYPVLAISDDGTLIFDLSRDEDYDLRGIQKPGK